MVLYQSLKDKHRYNSVSTYEEEYPGKNVDEFLDIIWIQNKFVSKNLENIFLLLQVIYIV